MQLTEHFSLEELCVTDTGLDNTPTLEIRQTGRFLQLAEFLEKARAIWGGHPVFVDSAYRNPAVNAAVGGVPDSAHMEAYAADVTCPDFGTPYECALAIVKAHAEGLIDYDQVIYEQTWVHLSRDPQLREMLLTHVPANGSYIDGIVGP